MLQIYVRTKSGSTYLFQDLGNGRWHMTRLGETGLDAFGNWVARASFQTIAPLPRIEVGKPMFLPHMTTTPVASVRVDSE